MEEMQQIVRSLGHIEGKIDGIISNQELFRTRFITVETDLAAHKAECASYRNRLVGAVSVLGGLLTLAWSLIVFFGASIRKLFEA